MCGATTSTCCCFTLIGGAVGGVAGLVTGIVKYARTPAGHDMPTGSDSVMSHLLMATMRFLAYAIGYAVLGLLLGAAVGCGIDFLGGAKFLLK